MADLWWWLRKRKVNANAQIYTRPSTMPALNIGHVQHQTRRDESSSWPFADYPRRTPCIKECPDGYNSFPPRVVSLVQSSPYKYALSLTFLKRDSFHPALLMSWLRRILGFPGIPLLSPRPFFVRPMAPLIIPSAVVIEEEGLPHYKLEHVYPVKIGDILQSRYKIIMKLGYGGNSTVWLARDLYR